MALRLRPPEVPWTPELRWVLARAFGSPERPFDEPVGAASAMRLATALGLTSRIGALTPEKVLHAEAGPEAGGFRSAARLTVARNLALVESVRSVARVAAAAGIPFVVLKGLAVEALRLVPGGARPTSDLDLLVPLERIPELQRRMLADGWTVSESLDLEQHLHPLVHPALGMTEIHRVLLGVRLPGSRRSVDFAALESAGFLQQVPELPDGVFAPVRPVLLAHSLVHGLVQHGSAPSSYPAFRVLGDVADLGSSPESLAEAGTYLRELDPEDLAAVGALVRALREGSGLPSTLYGAPYSVEGIPDPQVLLRHLVAGATDAAYAAGLRSSEGFLVPLSDLPPARAALRSAWRAVALSRKQIDQIYGPPRTALGYLARRLFRPFDLVFRYFRYAAARRRGQVCILRSTAGRRT
jgi:hypothetical protein